MTKEISIVFAPLSEYNKNNERARGSSNPVKRPNRQPTYQEVNNMKKKLALALSAMMLVGVLAGCSGGDSSSAAAGNSGSAPATGDSQPAAEGDAMRVDVFYYDFSDVYISSVRNNMDTMLGEMGGAENAITRRKLTDLVVKEGIRLSTSAFARARPTASDTGSTGRHTRTAPREASASCSAGGCAV